MALSKLHVVTALFNPWRYKSRKILYDAFRTYTRYIGHSHLYAGELAFGKRPFEFTTAHDHVTDDGETIEFQWRTTCELWHKERMLNRLIQELPNDWEYVAWVDADLQFTRPDWALETVHMLQHYPVVQLFSHSQNLGPKYEVLKDKPPRHGFVYAWRHGLHPAENDPDANNDYYYGAFQFGHPGFAWAIRRDQYEKLGGLLDFSILGSGDYHMALAFIGKLEERINMTNISDGYRRQLMAWATRAKKYINCNIGYVDGLVNHYWHGNRIDRRYSDRWQILVNNSYDPVEDLKYDANGMWQWTDRCPQLAYDCRSYMAGRHEDSIDIF